MSETIPQQILFKKRTPTGLPDPDALTEAEVAALADYVSLSDGHSLGMVGIYLRQREACLLFREQTTIVSSGDFL